MNEQQLASYRHQLVSANLAEFGDTADALNWISPVGAMAAQTERGKRLQSMGERLYLAFKGTKPHIGPLSPGCHICGEGDWSCLFVNGKCNCQCFYCPSSQAEIGVPTTNRVPFNRPADYDAYVGHFGFRGISISGGEPLLTPALTLRFLRTLDQSKERPLHLWMYTNGTLLTPDLVKKLKDAGLDEIRFDLSAVGYDLKKIRLAVGQIPIVTVEIPAIPEDFQRLRELLFQMKAVGVDYLNLHQLRLNPFNRDQLDKRKYTYLHGEKVTVLESELTALALMQHVVDQNIGLPVNYCASVFQHRFQRAAARRKSARLMVKPHESITECGYIRSLCLVGDPEKLARQEVHLTSQGVDHQLWSIGSRKDRLYFHPGLWEQMDTVGLTIAVGYSEASLCPHISYHRTFKEIRVNSEKRLFIEKQPVGSEIHIDDAQRTRFMSIVNHPASPVVQNHNSSDDRFRDYELIQPGLQDYF
ncbi:radical SAM protein [Desulfosarcina sp.]|uniref:radical SAM protein n=1 Tax=Desulfosarcina sp. TaxID=2027861 RepID=UPI0029B3715E|nr:radical SAM protein [Desulfosarcina sp.]MDX2452426.1 radical SAM protein [Desulfosarcina sp.]MDX2490203.1 radical SAM protein [Desulfosarcina sp.]